MEKQLGWTTLEQSKKLIETGFDHNTADMYYYYKDSIPQITDNVEQLKANINSRFYTPCWSLGRLIELMPDTISIGLKTYCLWINNKSCGYYRMKENLPTSGDCLCSYFKYNNSNPIFDCVLFLLGNNYIKKGETK